ncbi:MAG: GNAT family N-acetyltransferase [Pseudobacteriovorax sp.]|nr:GNAT family N-acetyltransferase [Pseudobacteriovorax sp.]
MNDFSLMPLRDDLIPSLKIISKSWVDDNSFWAVEDILKTLKSQASEAYLVFNVYSHCVGFMFVTWTGFESELLFVYCKEGQRGLGIGRHMLNHWICEAMKRKLNELFLEVSANNQTAIKLYESMGFRKLRTISNYYKNGDDAFAYGKRLEYKLD